VIHPKSPKAINPRTDLLSLQEFLLPAAGERGQRAHLPEICLMIKCTRKIMRNFKTSNQRELND
jgi:hypothetical protein